MADPQPEENQPAAGVPDPTRVDGGAESSTVDAPARWSGSAAVPPPTPKKQWWRRDGRPEGEEPTPADPWAATPAVDPWADQDTPWDTFTVDGTTPPPMPPTRVEPPAPAMPLTRVEPPPATMPPTRVEPPAKAAPPPPPPAPKAPAPAPARPEPPKLSKKERKRLKAAATANRLPVQPRPQAPMVRGRPLPAPPPWAPRPAQRPLPPPRRKRRWGRRLALLSLLGVVCCCGVPIAAFQLPSASQYPVTAALPQSFADLELRDTQDTGPNGFAGVYRDDRGKRVTVIGETGFRLTPGSDVGARLDQAAADYKLKDVQEFDLGESGAHQRCGVGRDKGAAVVVCAWADHGSLATVLLTRRSIQDSAELVARLRDEVLTRG
ncbi:hypothetical protein [Actinoplanes solisilvae]|uniref:hypothetical protein n=1 Tax=Actinoplanes solisilvae TaxID=2486853 RepID=UPI000FDAB059|nr:hypothetical protein [Actinoplanes solisilvae]